MKKYFLSTIGVLGVLLAMAQPIGLNKTNAHYFDFKGKPTVLVGSTEHYGAVINTAFDYKTYLKTLNDDGLNLVRIFGGPYYEFPGDFGIPQNTLAPEDAHRLLPWARSSEPGAFDGGTKFDLTQWNPAYFERLTDFIRTAAQYNIVVEVTLFSSYYVDNNWNKSPLNRDNNINNTPVLTRHQAQTLDNGDLMKHHEAYVRKMVQTLNGFDNLFFEIQNEPWADNGQVIASITDYFSDEVMYPGHIWKNKLEGANKASLEWQARISQIIADEQSKHPQSHLIAQNYCNYFYPLGKPEKDISILNFHYAHIPAVSLNYNHNKPIGFDESGFCGNSDKIYRQQAWQFFMAGGATLNHLDYSFSVAHPNGTAEQKAPGGGSPALRKQFGILKRFFDQLDLSRLKPDIQTIRSSGDAYAQCLSVPGKQYALYLKCYQEPTLELSLPKGTYQLQWWNTLTGQVITATQLSDGKTACTLTPPFKADDIALMVNKQ